MDLLGSILSSMEKPPNVNDKQKEIIKSELLWRQVFQVEDYSLVSLIYVLFCTYCAFGAAHGFFKAVLLSCPLVGRSSLISFDVMT